MKQDNIEILLNELVKRDEQRIKSLEEISHKIDSNNAFDVYNEFQLLNKNNKTQLGRILSGIEITVASLKKISVAINQIRIDAQKKSNRSLFAILTQSPKAVLFTLALIITILLMGGGLFDQMTYIDSMKDSYYKYEMTKYYDITLEEIEDAYDKNEQGFQSAIDSIKASRSSK